MAEPSPRATRFTIAAVMLALIVPGLGGFILGRATAPQPPGASAPLVPPPMVPPPREPVLPANPPPLDRAGLVAAAGRAADAFAAGQPLPADVSALSGRAFELRLAFACPGVPPAEPGLSAVHDETRKALRMRAQPVRWVPREWLPAQDDVAPDALVEAIEGFWISRPWTSSEACPAPLGADALPVAAAQTVGLAQFFTPSDSRIGRRDGKAFEAVARLPPGAPDLDAGLRLVLRGSIARGVAAVPVLCRAPDAMRPVCLVSVEFDDVAIESPATGAILARWDVSGQTREPDERSRRRPAAMKTP